MMSSEITKWVRVGLGCLFMLVGVLGVGFGVLGILDPVGTKMADDGDPFGTPHTLTESLTITGIYALVLLFGLWLMFAFGKRKLK